MVYLYGLAAALALISLIILVCTFEAKKTSFYIFIIMILIAVSNLGFFAVSISTSVSEAVLATKIGYTGACFTPLLSLLLTLEICNCKINGLLKKCMYGYCFLVYGLVLTIGYSGIYYDKIWLDEKYGATVLGHTYGFGHNLFYVILYGCLFINALIIAYSFVKKKAVSRNNLWALVVMTAATILLYVVTKIFNPYIETTVFIYVIDGWIFLYMYRRISIYNIEDNITSVISKQQEYGCIMFDNRMKYLGANDYMLQLIPELEECVVDKSVKNNPALKDIVDWVYEYKESGHDEFVFHGNENHYECKIERITYGKKKYGYIVEFRDDTDKWKYVNMLSSHNVQLEQIRNELEEQVSEQTAEIKEKQEQLEKLFVQTVTALSEAVDAKDRYTSGHSKRVAKYARMIAERMGKNKDEQEEIYRAGLLHDVGKIRIPAEIINKPGRLTDEEYNLIKLHSITGYHILRGISGDSFIAIAAKYHHERYDGKGYPNGLVGDKIPEVARILGVADSYDAMASNRSYRNALPQEVVKEELIKGMGTQFDPEVAKIMLQMMEEDKDYNMRQMDTNKRKVLTVDDEAINNKIIARIMKDEPMYEITSVESGQAALDIMENEEFNLILLDVKMPGMDGLETLKHIREKYDTPVVLMTSDKTLDTSIEFAKYGCDDYITKPFLPLMIQEVIHNMTERTEIS